MRLLVDQGHLRLDIVEGKDIHGADRSGTSDPYVIISLNGERIHKTEIKKKTLTPVWNETAECTVLSRVDADMTLEVFDWNQIETDQSIGTAKIDLSTLEPFTPSKISVPLVTSKYGRKGWVTLTLLFTPQIVAKSRKSTSTFSTAGRAVTQVGTAPLVVGKGVVSGVGAAGKGVVGGVGAVGKGVKGVFGGRKKSIGDGSLVGVAVNASGVPVINEPPPIAVPSSGLAGYNVSNESQTFPKADPTSAGGPVEGTLRVTGFCGRDMTDSDGDQVKPYVVVTVGGKEVKTKHLGKTSTPEW